MIDTVRNFAIDWQDWVSNENLSIGELSDWYGVIEQMAKLADPSGDLTNELKENGVL